ncbi:hypothetical protein ACQ86K_11425 [Mucilaginibacter sp. P19]
MIFSPVKSVLSKWLLTAMVMLCFFTFSGLTIQTTNKAALPDTTLVAGFVNRVSKSLSYKAAVKTAKRNNCSTLISGDISLPALSFLHSLEADISIKKTSKLFIPGRLVKRALFNQAFKPDLGDADSPL